MAKRFLDEGAEVYCLVRPESQKTECLPVHEHLHRIPAQMDEAVECVPQIGHADAFLHFAWRGVNRSGDRFFRGAENQYRWFPALH